jgi:hypothetical protein
MTRPQALGLFLFYLPKSVFSGAKSQRLSKKAIGGAEAGVINMTRRPATTAAMPEESGLSACSSERRYGIRHLSTTGSLPLVVLLQSGFKTKALTKNGEARWRLTHRITHRMKTSIRSGAYTRSRYQRVTPEKRGSRLQTSDHQSKRLPKLSKDTLHSETQASFSATNIPQRGSGQNAGPMSTRCLKS